MILISLLIWNQRISDILILLLILNQSFFFVSVFSFSFLYDLLIYSIKDILNQAVYWPWYGLIVFVSVRLHSVLFARINLPTDHAFYSHKKKTASLWPRGPPTLAPASAGVGDELKCRGVVRQRAGADANTWTIQVLCSSSLGMPDTIHSRSDGCWTSLLS